MRFLSRLGSESSTIDMSCIFCQIPKDRILFENEFGYAILDGYPVTDYHSLVIPKRHVEDYFGLTKDELLAADELIK